ncbi:MAG: TIGR04282 family arsenosugar biosynthesis glycosyltransferase [Gammaproteobacteria bacterium]|jgi:hypothetical protein|nr:TIGR04282 family arsenosugar biosynthesis glycosyltransferase [Gammaproteobacteria bacterium]
MPDEAKSAYRYPQARIVVFARAPLPGQVKTRLQAKLGPEGCLLLYTAMLDRLLATLRRAELAPVELWVSSNADHEVFISYCNKKDIYIQNGQDLGQKMHWAAGQVLANSAVDGVLIIGTDCPAMDSAYLEGALMALGQGNEVVIGPAEDGGYVLIGLKQPCPGLFQGIEWGSERVLSQTLQRLAQLKLPYALLEPLWDVDRPQDLQRLAELNPPLDVDLPV